MLKKHCIGADPYLIASWKAANQKQTARLPLPDPFFFFFEKLFWNILFVILQRSNGHNCGPAHGYFTNTRKDVILAQVHQGDFKLAWRKIKVLPAIISSICSKAASNMWLASEAMAPAVYCICWFASQWPAKMCHIIMQPYE